MKFDSTLTFSLIISIISLISPIIVAIINCHFQLSIKRLDSFETKNFDILSEFINATLEYKIDKVRFYKALDHVYLYCNVWGTIKPLPLKKIKELVEDNADIKDINNILIQFVLIANTNKNKIK